MISKGIFRYASIALLLLSAVIMGAGSYGQTPSNTSQIEHRRALSYGGRPYSFDACPDGCEHGLANDWAASMPSIPGRRSTVVAMGTTVSCSPHMSADHTTIFTECVLVVARVIKNSTRISLSAGSRIVITREGGILSINGHTFAMSVSGQRLPQARKRYVFFLRYRPETEDYSILTSYLVVGDQVYSVDQGPHFQAWNGKSLSAFRALVQSSIHDESPFMYRRQLWGGASHDRAACSSNASAARPVSRGWHGKPRRAM